MAATHWKIIIRSYLARLKGERWQFLEEELCRFLLHPYVIRGPKKLPYKWKNKQEVLDYIQDYLTRYEVDYAYHRKWARLGGMRSVAKYDKRAIQAIGKLLRLLSASLKSRPANKNRAGRGTPDMSRSPSPAAATLTPSSSESSESPRPLRRAELEHES